MVAVEMAHGAYGVMVPCAATVRDCAVRVLRSLGYAEMRPLHYVELARLAWSGCGWDPPDAEHARQSAEDLRQLVADGDDEALAYVSRAVVGAKRHPDIGRVFLREWLPSPQPLLINDACIEGPLDEGACTEAGVEAVFRLPHMFNRFNSPPEVRARRVVGGLIVEGNVRLFCARTWPALYRPPSNAGRYDEHASDDFNMLVGGRMLKFDVKRPDRGGRYGPAPGEKLGASVYLLSEAVGPIWRCRGWCTQKEFEAGLYPEQARSLLRLCVRLNCSAAGIDYGALRKAVGLSDCEGS